MEKKKFLSLISCGEISSLHLYILYSIISKCIKDFILSFRLVKEGSKSGIFGESELDSHILIKSFYKYMSFIIFGFAFLCFTKKRNGRKKKSKYVYINAKPRISHTSIIHLLAACILYVLFLELIEISYSLQFHDFDLWIFNIVFALVFLSIYYSIKHYKHQKYSLLFIFFTNFILIIIKTFYPKKSNAYTVTKNFFGSEWFSIAIYLLYILNSILISYARVLCKVLMEFKYISPYTIIGLIGIIGLSFVSVLIAISSKNECTGDKIYLCTIYDLNYKKNETSNYYDSINIYFKNLNYNFNNYKSKFWTEVFLISPLNLFINFMQFYYEIILIYFLNPIYILISDSLYYGTISLLNFIFLKNKNSDNIIKFFLNLLSDLFAFFGYIIYVELIELNFFGLNKNLRRVIIERGNLEIPDEDFPDMMMIDNEEEEEENENEKNDSEKKDEKINE